MIAINRSRGCTDIFFLLLLLAVTGGWVYFVQWARSEAPAGGGLSGISYRRAWFGADFNNSVCGEDGLPQLYHMPALFDALAFSKNAQLPTLLKTATKMHSFKVCVASCDETWVPDAAGPVVPNVKPTASDLEPTASKPMLVESDPMPTASGSVGAKSESTKPIIAPIAKFNATANEPTASAYKPTASSNEPTALAGVPAERYMRNYPMFSGKGIPTIQVSYACVPNVPEIVNMMKVKLPQLTNALNSTNVHFNSTDDTGAVSNSSTAVSNLSTAVSNATNSMNKWLEFARHTGEWDFTITYELGIPIILALIVAYILILRYASGLIVWTMMVLVFLVLCAISIGLFYYASFDDVEDHYKIAGYVAAVMCGLYLGLLLVMRKRVNFAIKVTKLAASAVQNMPSSLVVVAVVLVVQVAFLACWATLMCFVLEMRGTDVIETKFLKYFEISRSASDSELISSFETYARTDEVKWYAIGLCAYGLWIHEILWYLAYLALAGGFADWAFASTSTKRGSASMIASAFRAAFYHLGTVALAGLLLTVVKLLRAAVGYVFKKLKRANGAARSLAACTGCCLKVLEYIVERLSKYALVMTAIDGTNLFSGGTKVGSLFAQNLGRVTVLNWVVGNLLFLGKIIIMGLSAVLTAFVAETVRGVEWTTQIGPIALVMFIAYLTCTFVFILYNVAVDTMFLGVLIALDRKLPLGTSKIQKKFRKLFYKASKHMEEDLGMDVYEMSVTKKPSPSAPPQEVV
eukprot:421231_1